MIILKVVGTVTGVAVDEKVFATQVGGVDSLINTYLYDGNDWIDEDTSTIVNLETLGISYDQGTESANDVIEVAYHKSSMIIFSAGDGISAPDLNTNFDQLRTQSNNNEASINNIENTCLKIDGTNISDATVEAFNRSIVVTLSSSGTSNLTDNAEHFLAPTGNCTLNVPAVTQGDQFSHTINIAVQGSAYSVSLLENGALITRHLLNYENIDTTLPYNILLLYNHSDGHWYYYISQ